MEPEPRSEPESESTVWTDNRDHFKAHMSVMEQLADEQRSDLFVHSLVERFEQAVADKGRSRC